MNWSGYSVQRDGGAYWLTVVRADGSKSVYELCAAEARMWRQHLESEATNSVN